MEEDNGFAPSELMGSSAAPAARSEGKRFYDFDESRRHKALWQSAWALVIWIEAADGIDLAVLHWMGGTYKVVGHYRSQTPDGIELAKAHGERCSKSGYCPSAPGDNEAYLAELNEPRGLSASEAPISAEAVTNQNPVDPSPGERGDHAPTYDGKEKG